MKGEKVADVTTKASGSSTMSDFFRHGSVEERREVYRIAATAAICEQKAVINSASSGEIKTTRK